MPRYRVEKLEVHCVIYHHVEAEDMAAAIAKVCNGEAETCSQESAYVEDAVDLGLCIDDYEQAFLDRLHALGVDTGNDVIPSIRDIEKEED